MTDSHDDPVERALSSHGAFDPRADGEYDLSTTVFEAAVSGASTDGTHEFRVRVTVPTLDAAVAGETVAPVVEDGWFETLERRVADAYDVATTPVGGDLAVERADGEVRIEFDYAAADPDEGAADAKALIEFVEGTYVQGIVPGYDYRGEAATLLENARRRGDSGADGGGNSI